MVIRQLLALVLSAASTAPPAAHPMHTSVAEVRQDGGRGSVSVTMRVFPDDLARAVPAASTRAEAELLRYVRDRFSIADRAGRLLALQWVGAERVADVLVIRLRASAPAGLAGARIEHRLLQERFENQVNIVRATYAGRSATLIFLRGDAARQLP
jgi:hypothetical protein